MADVDPRDAEFMALALEESRRALPSPNPPVGAVVVGRDGNVVAQAHHERAGELHAEVLALSKAGENAKGGALYVTLEPCNHTGKTPPCVDAILAAGIKRVIVGCRDPNPHVEGGGIERLLDANVGVTLGVGEPEARAVIRPWLTFITEGVPHVSLKLALSLDGRIATRTGASKWVTGVEARAKVQELRAQRDAVAVGIGTALADDPLLTVRDLAYVGRRPRRVVFDSQLRLSLGSRLVTTSPEIPTIVLTTSGASADAEAALLDAGCEVFRVPPSGEGRVDIDAALRLLASMGVVSLLVEGGAELAGSFLATRFAHEMHAFVAPILLGPRGRPGAVDWAGPDRPSEAPRIEEPTWECCGSDAYVAGKLLFPDKG
ncbi:MAG: bifunctional diaminohydroxyphosphoribosylaminopyrimidine deaminase/5-amino-6-(5-phosphoribosylamino)uracil reductase RibD [Polyangiaceae bacterium]